jgi:hypothetical protein
MSTIGKRSASKSSRVATVDSATDDEYISRPWNVQVSPIPSSLPSGIDFICLIFYFLPRPCNVR